VFSKASIQYSQRARVSHCVVLTAWDILIFMMSGSYNMHIFVLGEVLIPMLGFCGPAQMGYCNDDAQFETSHG